MVALEPEVNENSYVYFIQETFRLKCNYFCNVYERRPTKQIVINIYLFIRLNPLHHLSFCLVLMVAGLKLIVLVPLLC